MPRCRYAIEYATDKESNMDGWDNFLGDRIRSDQAKWTFLSIVIVPIFKKLLPHTWYQFKFILKIIIFINTLIL